MTYQCKIEDGFVGIVEDNLVTFLYTHKFAQIQFGIVFA